MPGEQVSVDKEELEFDQSELRRIRERVLEAEKEKLNLDLPRGVINDIEDIIREEVT
jgi:urease accessory protein UreE